jgi:hypothetical protein
MVSPPLANKAVRMEINQAAAEQVSVKTGAKLLKRARLNQFLSL